MVPYLNRGHPPIKIIDNFPDYFVIVVIAMMACPRTALIRALQLAISPHINSTPDSTITTGMEWINNNPQLPHTKHHFQ